MPKNNEFANITQTENVSTLPNETGNKESQEPQTYLTEKNIRLLKAMFKDEQTYIEKMDVLWIVRALAQKECEIPGKTVQYDQQSPYFRLATVLNDFIGALGNGWVSFTFDGKNIRHNISHLREK